MRHTRPAGFTAFGPLGVLGADGREDLPLQLVVRRAVGERAPADEAALEISGGARLQPRPFVAAPRARPGRG